MSSCGGVLGNSIAERSVFLFDLHKVVLSDAKLIVPLSMMGAQVACFCPPDFLPLRPQVAELNSYNLLVRNGS
jgi:hypothetical protein